MEIIAIIKALALSTAQISPAVLAVVEIVKRFIPNQKRDVANPALAAITGIVGAYMVGGQQEVINILLQGLLAAAAAVGAYKIPKEIGSRLGIE